MTMMHCILKWRLICSYGVSPRKRQDDESYKCAIERMSFIQTTIHCSKRSLAEYLLEHHDLIVIGPRDLLPQADGDGPWSSARVEISSSGLKRDQCVGKKSQRLRGLAFISGNLKNESVDGGGEGAPHVHLSKGETIAAALRQCVSLGGRRGKKTAKPWRARFKSRSSYLQLFKDLPSGPTVFSTLTLYDKQSAQKQVNRYGYQPTTGLQDVAWLSLDGRLMNADTATSLDRMGGHLGEPEAHVWEGLNPLQRVLIVAVAAAAAAAAKEKSTHEVACLHKVINQRESALMHMKQELSSLLIKVEMQRSQISPERSQPCHMNAVEELTSLIGQVDMQRPQYSPRSAEPDFYTAVNQFCDSLGEFTELDQKSPDSPAVNRQLNFSNVMKRVSPMKEESPISGGPGLELMEKLILSNSWIDSLDIDLLLNEAANDEPDYRFEEHLVNKDVVFEERGDGKDEPVEGGSEAGKEDIRPNGVCDPGVNNHCEPVSENGLGHEWLSETSSVVMDPFSPQPLEKQRRKSCEVHTSNDWTQNIEAAENAFVARARCANIIIDVKKQVISLLDEAASNMLEALNNISEKARLLEGEETVGLTPLKPQDAWNRTTPVSSTIEENVGRVSARIAALQTTMVHVWQTLGPEAMASLDISPPEFDDYLTNLQIAKILNEDATELTMGNVIIQSWQEWFRRGFDNPESSFLRKIQSTDHEDHLEDTTQALEQQSWTPSKWPPSGDIRARKTTASESSMVTPAALISTREKVDKIMSPLYEKTEEQSTSTDSCDNLVTVAEQIAAELEKSSAKVAAMEIQMKNLKKYVKACDLKRKQVERKLLEAWEQDSKNQVKAGNEIMELKRQVSLKESAYQELIRSRKALVGAKSQEISALREDCNRRDLALKDMATAAQATEEASEKKLAVLEEICRKKDTAIMTLKQEIFELEAKVQELQACQTPAQLRPMNLPPENDADSAEDLFLNERGYRLFGADDCQLRSSFTSMCGSENRRTSWGSDMSGQEFHIIDTPWSSELAGQDFNVIDEAAFQGRSLSIFQNVTSSQEFPRGALRKFTDGGPATPASSGSTSGMDSSSSTSRRSGEAATNSHPRDIKRSNIPSYRKELSKSVTGMVTTRPKRRDDAVRSSTGVLSTVGLNTPIKPKQRSSSVSKERVSRQAQSVNGSLNGGKPKENSSRGSSRQKWV